MLWRNDPSGGVGLTAPNDVFGCEFPELLSTGLHDALAAADASSPRTFKNSCIQPVELAGIIACELRAVLPQLAEFASYSNPTTISVHADLASELGGAAFPMLVSEFIKRFASPSPK